MESVGLLGTKVTWLAIESTMQKSMGTESCFGVNKTITNIGDNKVFSGFYKLKPISRDLLLELV